MFRSSWKTIAVVMYLQFIILGGKSYNYIQNIFITILCSDGFM